VRRSRLAAVLVPLVALLAFAQPTAAGETYDSKAKLKLTGHLDAKVTVTAEGSLEDGPPNIECENYRPVVIQRKTAGKWKKVASGSTGPYVGQPTGAYKTPIPDKGGKYRAVAKRMEVKGGVCVKAISTVVKHTH
jgi:hypothetical protein